MLCAPAQLLTACEREFGMSMPHAALNHVKSVDDVVNYWEGRMVALEEEQAAAAQHFTVAHPPNVFVGGKGRGSELREWLQEHALRPDQLAEDDEDRRIEIDDDEDDEMEADELDLEQSPERRRES